MIITIDGAVATGKSSVARGLALSLGYIFFDTGAMYRSLTYGLIKKNIDINNEKKLKAYLDTFDFDMKIKRGEKLYYVEGEDVTEIIRGLEVTQKVSDVAAIPIVREKLVEIQKELATGVNAVFEGRDMGTVVFPKADLKIFLTGRTEVRAERRLKELREKFPEMADELTPEAVLENLTKRDEIDTTRKVSPLKAANDAYIIDTSDLSCEDVVNRALECKDRHKRSL
ncbi:MAG: Cytidylate kinase [Chlamydiae bacterium]|nr:Cytidylate kinase [Chlamydiota bacterium]